MNKVAILLVTTVLCGPYFAQNANMTPAGANTKTVTITGTIMNFDKFKAVVQPKNYIQLVPLMKERFGSFSIEAVYDGAGFAAYDSPLVELPIPKDAVFNFTVPNVSPGTYVLVAQNRRPVQNIRGEQVGNKAIQPGVGAASGAYVPGGLASMRVDNAKVYCLAMHKGPTWQNCSIIVVKANSQSPYTINAGDIVWAWSHY